MTAPFDTDLGTALRDRVADVHPDLDQLVASATRAGTRIRLRRRIGICVAAAAGVAAIATGAALIGGGSTPKTVDGGVGFAADPTPSAVTSPVAPTPDPRTTAPAGRAPAEVTAAGWTCEWYLADDKGDCSGPAGKLAGLVIRPAKAYAAWMADHDKGAGPGVFTTEPHGDVFITVQSGAGSTDADLAALGRSLRWVD